MGCMPLHPRQRVLRAPRLLRARLLSPAWPAPPPANSSPPPHPGARAAPTARGPQAGHQPGGVLDNRDEHGQRRRRQPRHTVGWLLLPHRAARRLGRGLVPGAVPHHPGFLHHLRARHGAARLRRGPGPGLGAVRRGGPHASAVRCGLPYARAASHSSRGRERGAGRGAAASCTHRFAGIESCSRILHLQASSLARSTWWRWARAASSPTSARSALTSLTCETRRRRRRRTVFSTGAPAVERCSRGGGGREGERAAGLGGAGPWDCARIWI